jgi:hypothetical protein
MNFNGLKSRLERLERRTKGGECDGCNRTASLKVAARFAAHKNGGSVDPTIELASCPDCGNPHPQVSIRYAREAMDAYRKRLAARG